MEQKDTSLSPVTVAIFLLASTVCVAALVGASGAMDSVYENEYQIEYEGEPSAQELVTRGGTLSGETSQIVSESDLSVNERDVFEAAKSGETVVIDSKDSTFRFDGPVFVGPIDQHDYSVVFVEGESGTVSEYQVRTIFNNSVLQWILMDGGAWGLLLVWMSLGMLSAGILRQWKSEDSEE